MIGQERGNLGRSIDTALAAKDWGRGLELLEQWCDRHPANARGWLWKAQCQYRLHRPSEALETLRKALELDPEDARAVALKRRLEVELSERPDERERGALQQPLQHPDLPPPTLTDAADDPVMRDDGPPRTVLASAVGPADPAHLETDLFSELTEKQLSPWKKGAVIDGHYEVRDVVHGGMGVVYFVFDTEMALDLAVKTPLQKALATPSGRARFLREAEAWIGLGLHPNICSAYYVRTLGGIPRLFIEFIDGGSLDQWIKRELLASALERLDLAIQIASGMHHAHTFAWVDEDGEKHQGVVHRDLKPANVLIGSDGIARVTDFGLVGRGADSEDPLTDESEDLQPITQTGGIWGTVTLGGSAIGTPPYMPPEQWSRAHLADKPADIYAFGCILYELFCGRRLFVLDDAQRRARPEAQLLYWRDLHCKTDPTPPRELEPLLDEELADLIIRCVAKEPGDRPPGFEDLRKHLKDIYSRLAGKPYPRPEPHASRLTADALNNRAVSFVTLGQEHRAERIWGEALSIDPHHTEANYNLAVFRWRAREASDTDTSAFMEEVRTTQASLWKEEHLSGRVALILGRWEEALRTLKKAVHASQGSPEVARDCGLALCAMARETGDQNLWKDASDLLSRCGGPLRKDPTLLVAYSLAQHQLGNGQVAARLYASARQRTVDLPDEIDAGARRLLPGLHLRNRIPGLSGRVYGISADVAARTAATLTQDGRITIWDSFAGAPVHTVKPPGPRPRCIALTAAGDLLLTSSEGDPVNTWDLQTGLPVYRLQPHAGFLSALAVTDDGRRAAAVGTFGSLIVWDLATRAVVASHPVTNGFLSCLAIAEDNRRCIAGGNEGMVAVIDLEDGHIRARPSPHETVITAVALDSQAHLGGSGDEGGAIFIWDARTGVRRHHLLGHTGPIRFLSLRRGGTFCLSASADGTARVWDLTTGRPVFSVRLSAAIHAGFATRDWSSVVMDGGRDHLVHWRLDEVSRYRPAWAVSTPVSVAEAEDRASEFVETIRAARDLATQGRHSDCLALIDQARTIPGYERMSEALELTAEVTAGYPHEALRAGWEERTIQAHDDRITSLAVDAGGTRIATAAADRRIRLWNAANGALVSTWDTGIRPETSVDFVPGADTVLSGGLTNDLSLRSIEDGVAFMVCSGHDAQINQIAVDHRGQRFLSASADGTTRLWDRETGICLRIMSGHGGEVFCCAMSPDSRFAASGGADGILVWDLETGNELCLLTANSGAIYSLAFSNDGRFLLSAGADASLRRWDIAQAACVQLLDCETQVLTVALAPNDRHAVTGEKDGKVRLWDLKTGACLRTFAGHRGGALATVFSPDGRRLFTAGADGLVKTWYFDWKAAMLPEVDWADDLDPYLEVFLAGCESGTGRPRWSGGDCGRLESELARRGFGWVGKEGLQERLKEMTLGWPGHTTVGAALLEHSRAKRRPTSPARRSIINVRRRAITVAAAVVLPVMIFIGFRISHLSVHFNQRVIAESRRQVLNEVVRPISEFTRGSSCDDSRFSDYLETFTQHDGELWEIELARHCLEKSGNPAAVGPALDMLRSDSGPTDPGGANVDHRPIGAYTDVLSLLIRMGDRNCPELADALSDPDSLVRTVATRALAYRGSEESIRALVDRADDREPLVRIAVSSALQEIVSSGRIGRREALRLYEQLAQDTWPEVRRNVAANLPILAGGRPRELARRLTGDRDEEVRQIAEASLARMD